MTVSSLCRNGRGEWNCQPGRWLDPFRHSSRRRGVSGRPDLGRGRDRWRWRPALGL